MKHFFKFKLFNFGRKYQKLLFINYCNSLIKYEFLNISVFKAKQLRIFLEPLINISKNYSSFNFKFLISKINNFESVFKLFKVIGPRYFFRNGGYIKILKSNYKNGSFHNSMVFFS